MYISRGFSHGISSPVTEVGRIFFFCFSFCRFPFPFSLFSLFFCYFLSVGEPNEWLLGFQTRSTWREFIFRFPRHGRVICNRSQRPITSRIFILIDERAKRCADIYRQYFYLIFFFLIFTNTCKLTNFTGRNGTLDLASTRQMVCTFLPTIALQLTNHSWFWNEYRRLVVATFQKKNGCKLNRQKGLKTSSLVHTCVRITRKRCKRWPWRIILKHYKY